MERAAFKQVHFLEVKENALFGSVINLRLVTSYLGGQLRA